MKILLLAPHPFFKERGTPIAVDLLLQNYARKNVAVDVLTYHEGENKCYNNVTIRRIPPLWIKNIRPGFSAKKIWCDLFFFRTALQMIDNNKYELIHAVEESVFMALFFKKKKGIPYVYDMDSSMPSQIADNSKLFKPLLPLMKKMEQIALQNAIIVLPVCEELANIAEQAGNTSTIILRDISLLYRSISQPHELSSIRKTFKIGGIIFLYLGNLEPYQGIDLLLHATAKARNIIPTAKIVIAGGTDKDIKKYQQKAYKHGINDMVIFIGHKSLEEMGNLFAEADILVSPRISGNNTPMKIYSYLDSGKAILATDLPTHTQVLNESCALLVSPTPDSFANGMIKLAQDVDLRDRLGQAAKLIATEHYSISAYEKAFDKWYETLMQKLQKTIPPKN